MGDVAAQGGFLEQPFHLVLYAAGAGDMPGFDKFLKFQDFEMEDVLVVFVCGLFYAIEQPQGLHIHAFTVQNAGEVDLLADFDVDVLLDVDEAQADEELLVEVALEISQVAFGYPFQFGEQLVLIVFLQPVEGIEKFDEFAFRPAVQPVGVKLEIAFFGLV